MILKNSIQKEIATNQFLFDTIQDVFVKQRISSQFEWFVEKAVRYKYWYYILTTITIISPVTSAIILNLPYESFYLKISSSILLGASTIAAALLNMLNCQKKWQLYRSQAEDIKRQLVRIKCAQDISEIDTLAEIENSILITDKKWCKEQKKV